MRRGLRGFARRPRKAVQRSKPLRRLRARSGDRSRAPRSQPRQACFVPELSECGAGGRVGREREKNFEAGVGSAPPRQDKERRLAAQATPPRAERSGYTLKKHYATDSPAPLYGKILMVMSGIFFFQFRKQIIGVVLCN